MKKITNVSLVGSIFAILVGAGASFYALIYLILGLLAGSAASTNVEHTAAGIVVVIALIMVLIAFVNLFSGIGALARKEVTKKFLKIWGILCIVSLIGIVGRILLVVGSTEQN